MYDILIIGGGITGAAIAYELSKYDLKVALLEKENDVATETTKANTRIVHAGYDPMPGTLMARLNVLGSQMYEKLAPMLNVHYHQIGSLVIGRDADEELIKKLYDRGIANGVRDLSIVRGEELKKLEPNLKDDISVALLAKSAAVVSPWEMCLALAENAVRNGVKVYLSTPVTNVTKEDDIFIVESNENVFKAKYVINAAGVYADKIYKMVLKDKASESFTITPVKGEYYLLDKSEGELVNHVVFQTPSALGKGVLVSKTVHGNLIVGPNALTVDDKSDVSVTSDALAYVRKMAALTSEKIGYRNNIRNFSGIRAQAMGIDDFIIGESSVKGFINFAGIKSPGLSAAPAFGPEAVSILEKMGVKLNKKDSFTVVPLPKYFKDMSREELSQMVAKDSRYGRIVCRCETVSEGEIVEALHRPIPALSIDAVKRRCNAGMGRCQGGFCGPKVLEIMVRELNITPKDVLQDKAGSYIVLEYTKEGK